MHGAVRQGEGWCVQTESDRGDARSAGEALAGCGARGRERHGISAEVIDLRSLSPLDMETVGDSVRRTNKVLVPYEDALPYGVGSEAAVHIADELFP